MDKKIAINRKKKPMQADLGWPSTPRLKKDLTPVIMFFEKKKVSNMLFVPSKMVTGKSKKIFFYNKNLFSSVFLTQKT